MKRFIRMLGADLRCGLCPRFWVATAIVPLLIVADNSVDLIGVIDRPTVFYLHFWSISYGGLCGTYLVGMLCALPYANAFVNEWSVNMVGTVMARCGRRNYFLSKKTSNCILGGLVNLLGQILLFLLLRWGMGLAWFDADDVPIILNAMGMGYFSIALYYAFLNGALMAGMAMGVSAYVRNINAVLVAPAVFQFLHIQINRLFGTPLEWQVNQWLALRSYIWNNRATMALSLAAVLIIIAIMTWLFSRQGKKVIAHA